MPNLTQRPRPWPRGIIECGRCLFQRRKVHADVDLIQTDVVGLRPLAALSTVLYHWSIASPSFLCLRREVPCALWIGYPHTMEGRFRRAGVADGVEAGRLG